MGFRSYDIAIIGGGTIGLATAMRLSQEYPGRRLAVLEKEPEIARHQTGPIAALPPSRAPHTFDVSGRAVDELGH